MCPEGVLSRRRRGHAKASFCRAPSWRWEAFALLHNSGLCFVLDAVSACTSYHVLQHILSLLYHFISCHVIPYHVISYYIILYNIVISFHIMSKNKGIITIFQSAMCTHYVKIFPSPWPDAFLSKDAKPTWDDHPGYSWGRQSAGVFWGPDKAASTLFMFFQIPFEHAFKWVFFNINVCLPDGIVCMHTFVLLERPRFATDRRSCSAWSPRSSVSAPRSPATPQTSCLTWRSRMVWLKFGTVLSSSAIPWCVWRSQTRWQTLKQVPSLAALLWHVWFSQTQWRKLIMRLFLIAELWRVSPFQTQWHQ